jgi:hypothetical protein
MVCWLSLVVSDDGKSTKSTEAALVMGNSRKDILPDAKQAVLNLEWMIDYFHNIIREYQDPVWYSDDQIEVSDEMIEQLGDCCEILDSARIAIENIYKKATLQK